MDTQRSLRNHPLYRLGLWIALAASLMLLWYMNANILSNPKYIPVDDFSHYWAAGRLNISGKNPYDPSNVQQLRNELTEKETEYATVPIMWTPPWSLPFVMPFGGSSYSFSRMLWLIVSVGLVLVSANLNWRVYGGNPRKLLFAWMAAFLFGPTISVLEKGQLSTWVLFGIAGFLYFHEVKKQPFIAGILLVFASLKPHLIYLIWPAVLLWSVSRRSWKILSGLTVGLILTLFISILPNPDVISDYITALRTYPPADWATPTLGSYLRIFINVEYFWLQFIPPILGLVWFCYLWVRQGSTWTWMDIVPVVSLGSILTAPYAWTYDQVILVTAMISVVVLLRHEEARKKPIVLWAIYIGITILNLILHRFFDEFWFGWHAPTLLIWYLTVRHLSLTTSNDLESSEPQTA